MDKKKIPGELWSVELMCLENGVPQRFRVFVEKKHMVLLAKVLELKKVSQT